MIINAENRGILCKMNSDSLLCLVGENYRENKMGVKKKFQLHLPTK